MKTRIINFIESGRYEDFVSRLNRACEKWIPYILAVFAGYLLHGVIRGLMRGLG
jgi:hypothetical protein